MDGQDFLHGFVFDDHRVVNQHVGSEAQVDLHVFVGYRQRDLACDGMPGFLQFIGQALLVHGFQETRAEGFVYLDGAVNDGFGCFFDVFQ